MKLAGRMRDARTSAGIERASVGEVVMRILKRRSVSVAALCGDDFHRPSLLEDALQCLIENLKDGKLVLDLSRVESLTGLGVAVLVAAKGMAMIYSARLEVACVQPRVGRSLELAGAGGLLSPHETVDGAVRALQSSSLAPPRGVVQQVS